MIAAKRIPCMRHTGSHDSGSDESEKSFAQQSTSRQDEPAPGSPSVPSDDSLRGPLSESVVETQQRALDALAMPARMGRLEAVAGVSKHLAATRQVLLPLQKRRLGLSRSAADQQRTQGAKIHRLLRRIESQLGGDGRIGNTGTAEVRARLGALLKTRFQAERLTADELDRALSDEDADEAAAAYRKALEDSPSRPHPHAAAGRGNGRMWFRFNGFRDRVMDVLDARQSPHSRPTGPHLSKRQLRNQEFWSPTRSDHGNPEPNVPEAE